MILPDRALCTSVLSAWPPVLVMDTSTPGSGSESSRECSPVNKQGTVIKFEIQAWNYHEMLCLLIAR